MQGTNRVFMVKPNSFCFNAETAVNNHYQHNDSQDLEIVQKKAESEFNLLVEKMRKVGIKVHIVEDTALPATPDSIFPNNWFSTHREKIMFIYPMYANNRRIEVEKFKNKVIAIANRKKVNIVDYSFMCDKNQFLEGTGSIVLDRVNRIAYCSLSQRANKELLEMFCKELGYKSVVFTSLQDGKEIYHTNVMMSVCENKVIICLECIENLDERENVKKIILESGKKIVEISLEQVKKFAGNMLELKGRNNQNYLLMSDTAYNSLTEEQLKILELDSKIIHSDVSTIEYYGGGSVRCMIAELF